MPPRILTSPWPVALGVWAALLPPGARAQRDAARAESLYREVRTLKDRIDITAARGLGRTPDGTPVAALLPRYAAARARLVTLLAAPDTAFAAGDRAAVATMKRTLDGELVERLAAVPGAAGAETEAGGLPCVYDPERLAAGPTGREALAERMYACYGRAARTILFEGDTLDRLTILGLLSQTADPDRRRRLFLALEPVWRSVNGDGGPHSPYRRLVGLTAAHWRGEESGRGGSPVEASLQRLGIAPGVMERWLTAILEQWRAVTPPRPVEPWDFHFATGRAGRVLGSRIPRARLTELNTAYFRALGADPDSLGIRYDLDPRPGKTPVAFTTFGSRTQPEPWVFATYRVGGLDNLSELFHETGHAIHIAAIRTRPAFQDWPDSDPFTEALGDLVSLDIYAPAWQQRWLGDSVPLADALRAKYAGIVLDVAWSLFEIRLHRNPALDPNQVWTELTRDYLRIVPHPELSWWAMRGQLINAPGYMMNYAIGAIIVADLRARMAVRDRTWYRRVAERLYRFGLERPSREVIEEFLGRPLSPRALLEDMARIDSVRACLASPRRYGGRRRARQRRRGPARSVGCAAHLRDDLARPVLRPGVRGRAGPVVANGDVASRRRGTARRSPRPRARRVYVERLRPCDPPAEARCHFHQGAWRRAGSCPPRTWCTPTWTGTSAGSPRVRIRCAPGRDCCRCREMAGSSGRASWRRPSCPRASIPRAGSS